MADKFVAMDPYYVHLARLGVSDAEKEIIRVQHSIAEAGGDMAFTLNKDAQKIITLIRKLNDRLGLQLYD